MVTTVVPAGCKLAIVVQIYYFGDTTQPCNFRPVSVLHDVLQSYFYHSLLPFTLAVTYFLVFIWTGFNVPFRSLPVLPSDIV